METDSELLTAKL